MISNPCDGRWEVSRRGSLVPEHLINTVTVSSSLWVPGQGLNEVQIQVADQIGNAGTRFVTLLSRPSRCNSRGDRVEDIDFAQLVVWINRGRRCEDLNTNRDRIRMDPVEGVTVYLDRNENSASWMFEPKTQAGQPNTASTTSSVGMSSARSRPGGGTNLASSRPTLRDGEFQVSRYRP